MINACKCINDCFMIYFLLKICNAKFWLERHIIIIITVIKKICKKYSRKMYVASDSDMLSSVPGPSGIRGYFYSMEERSQKHADECLAWAVYATSSLLMLPTNVYWRFLRLSDQHTFLQPDAGYIVICWMKSSTECKQRSNKPLTKQTAFQSYLMGGQIFRDKELQTTFKLHKGQATHRLLQCWWAKSSR